jgi:hypothetical protein
VGLRGEKLNAALRAAHNANITTKEEITSLRGASNLSLVFEPQLVSTIEITLAVQEPGSSKFVVFAGVTFVLFALAWTALHLPHSRHETMDHPGSKHGRLMACSTIQEGDINAIVSDVRLRTESSCLSAMREVMQSAQYDMASLHRMRHLPDPHTYGKSATAARIVPDKAAEKHAAKKKTDDRIKTEIVACSTIQEGGINAIVSDVRLRTESSCLSATREAMQSAQYETSKTVSGTSSDHEDFMIEQTIALALEAGPRLFKAGERVEGDWYRGDLHDDGESEEGVLGNRVRSDMSIVALAVLTLSLVLLWQPARAEVSRYLAQASLPRFISILIALTVAFYAGIDVVPGEINISMPTMEQPENDFTLRDLLDGRDQVVRLRRADGRAISEDDEARLVPLLEAMDRSLEMEEAGDEVHREAIRNQIKALQIYSDAEVDAIQTRVGITHILMQMEATVPLWRHCFRAMVVIIFIYEHDLIWSGHPFPALAIELLLPFAPYGHPVTTAGRHFDGSRTWLGLRRFDLGMILLLQAFSAFTLHLWGTIVLKSWGISQLRIKCWADRAHALLCICSAALFAKLACGLYLSGPSGWIWEDDAAECAAEFTPKVAVAMHRFYIALIAWELIRTISSTSFALYRFSATMRMI